MMKLLRRHKDWLMIVIAILAIPFVFYFVQRPDYGAMRSDRFAHIYDRNVSMLEAQQLARLLSLAQALGMSDFVQTLTAGAGLNQNQVAVQFIVNLLVLRHEAERLGLRPSAPEIADVVRKLPAFQGESGFDINKFSDFVRNGLGPLGLGEGHIEQLVRDEICMNEIKKLLAGGITISKGELDENFHRGYDNFYVSVIRFRSADFENGITVSDEDVRKYYDAHKAELKSDEKRKVQFVQLGLTEEQKKLTGKERIEVLQVLSNRANDFTQLEGADFKQAAGKLPVHETGEFTRAAPDPQLKVDPQLATAAFKLSMQEPTVPVQVADGFYILHLTAVTEARPLTLEEAKPKIVDALKKSKARELMSTKGAEVANQVREATKSGQPLEPTIQKAGVKLEKIPPFALIEKEKAKPEGKEPNQGKEPKNESPDLTAIKDAVAFLSPGEISDFSPSGENGFIALLEKRKPSADADAAEKKAAFEKRLLDNKQRIVFYEWLHDRQQAAGLQFQKG
jgi:hypothetical protein